MKTDQRDAGERIAITGMGCLFPGARSPEEFWELLAAGKSGIGAIGERELGRSPEWYFDPVPGTIDKVCSLKKGLVKGFAFDPQGYAVPPEELSGLDDLFRWTLHVGRATLADAGRWPHRDPQGRTGLLLGNFCNPTTESNRFFGPLYRDLVNDGLARTGKGALKLEGDGAPEAVPIQNALIFSHPAALAARALALGGPTFAIDAACATATYIIELASLYLRAGLADVMLAGAICKPAIITDSHIFNVFGVSDGTRESRPFDRRSFGIVSGEGIGMVALRRLSDAVRDGDRILAVIDGIGLSNDGGDKHLLAPSSQGQELAYTRAYASGALSRDLDYLECHATGTSVGDQVELDSIERFFGDCARRPRFGAVKANTGHLLAASGFAGIIKVLLAMQKGEIPPTIGVEEPLRSRHGLFAGELLVRERQPWPKGGRVKRAGVNAFGFGGANAHLVLSEHAPEAAAAPAPALARPRMGITGMGALFGRLRTLSDFKAAVSGARAEFGEIRNGRWLGLESSPALLAERYGLDLSRAGPGAFIDDLSLDALGLKVSPAEDPNPMMRNLVMLNVADQALRDAGLVRGRDRNVAVVIGLEYGQTGNRAYARLETSWQLATALERSGLEVSPAQRRELEAALKDCVYYRPTTSNLLEKIANITAARISSAWGLNGPSFVMGSMENTAAKAIQVAQLLLSRREIDAVLVGTIDFQGELENVLLRQRLFPQDNGLRIGEGAGAIVLKRLDDVVERREPCYAAVDAVAVARCGPPGDPAAADPKAVAACCRSALAAAGAAPADVGYIEIAGCNGAEQSALELAALREVYGGGPATRLGSVKENVGDTFASSGMAAVMKMALCLRDRFIPGTPDASGFERRFRVREHGFAAAPASSPWDKAGARRQAVVNALGYDGACSHVVMSELDRPSRVERSHLDNFEHHLLVVSAAGASPLVDRLGALGRELAASDDLGGIAARLHRAHAAAAEDAGRITVALVGRDQRELLAEVKRAEVGVRAALERGGEWSTPSGSYFTARPLPQGSKVAFVFPLGGAVNYRSFERYLYLFPGYVSDFDAYKEAHARRNGFFKLHGGAGEADTAFRISGAGEGDEAEHPMITQAANAELHLAILRDVFKVAPDMAFGCSFGELVLMIAFGMIDDSRDDSPFSLKQLIERTLAQLQDEACIRDHYLRRGRGEVEWRNYFVRGDIEALQARVAREEDVFLTIHCSPRDAFLSGLEPACSRIIGELGLVSFPTERTFVHTPVARALAEDVCAEIARRDIGFRGGGSFESCYSIDMAPHVLDRDVFRRVVGNCLSERVDFTGFVRRMHDRGARVFIDMGPQDFCAGWIRETLRGEEHLALAASRKGESDEVVLLSLLGRLVANRVAVDLSRLYRVVEQGHGEKAFRKRVVFSGIDVGRALSGVAAGAPPAARVPLRSRGPEAAVAALVPAPRARAIAPPGVELAPHAALHLAYLRLQNDFHDRILAACGARHGPAVERGWAAGGGAVTASALAIGPETPAAVSVRRAGHLAAAARPAGGRSGRPVIWDEAQLVEMTDGSMARVLGPEYARADVHPIRARMPSPPFLFVSRITGLDARRGALRPCAIEMEYDIPDEPWYALNGEIPVPILWESTHCMIFLLSYLGVDEQFDYELRYRVTDSTTRFCSDYVFRPGDTFRNDIRIKSFIRSRDKLLVFYEIDTFHGDRLFMRIEGAGGMFSDQDLASSKGYLGPKPKPVAAARPRPFTPLLRCERTAFGAAELQHLKRGRPEDCFGPAYRDETGFARRLCCEELDMLDRVTRIEPGGGYHGLGLVEGEKDVPGDHWAFAAHFKNDPVLPGTLMMEGCTQLLLFYCHYLGMLAGKDGARTPRPLTDQTTTTTFRGQVERRASTLRYVVHVKEIVLAPSYRIVADIEVFHEGRNIIFTKNHGFALT